ncbi:MAG: ATP synthase F1 subunit delta [Planctomycetota bacterium]
MAGQDSEEIIAHVYAQALFDVATETASVAQVEEELRLLLEAITKSLLLRRFMETPTLSFEKKRKALYAVFHNLSQPLLNFMLLVMKRQRMSLLQRIANIFHEHANAKSGIAEFDLTSARALESDELVKLKDVLRRKFKREVAVREVVSPKLLGGMIMKHGGWLWDVSLDTRLNRLVEQIESFKGGLATWAE